MSYRSALSNPQTNSGSVGTIKTAGGTSFITPIPLTNNAIVTIDTITLGAGVWHIVLAQTVNFAPSTAIEYGIVRLSYTGFIFEGYIFASPFTYTGASNGTSGGATSCVVVLSGTTTLTMAVQCGFTAGTVTVSIPFNSTGFITATKLA